MGVHKREDVLGAQIDAETVCVECIEVSEWD